MQNSTRRPSPSGRRGRVGWRGHADVRAGGRRSHSYHVINYGFGGVYMPHHDFVHHYRKAGMENMPALKNSGDRIATWIFYLSDVTKGGSTVFPVLQTTVSVTKGSAVFWYNLQRNGEPDDRLLHGGCPVLFGEKWVATKWIREGGQIFTRPCSLNSNL